MVVTSSSALRGAATRTRSGRGIGRGVSSSALRGAATSTATAAAQACRVIIGPTRGSNIDADVNRHDGAGHHQPYEGQQPDVKSSPASGRPGHHQPYEGQQHRRPARSPVLQPGHHRPYEGQQPTKLLRPPAIRPGHHRPYEGQQHDDHDGGHRRGHHRPYEGQQQRMQRRAGRARPPSSSALRGAATGCSTRRAGPRPPSSSALRGAATWGSRPRRR